jgi:hypothetical protein
MRTTDARRPRRASTAFAVAAVSAAAFFALLGGLAIQLANGNDPALADNSPATEPAQQPRRILVRRIHRRIIVTHVVPAPESDDSVASTSVPPISSAPALSPTPAPAPAPVPVPAPAPVPPPVTSSS